MKFAINISLVFFSPLTILETPAETLQVPVVDIEHDPLHDQASERASERDDWREISSRCCSLFPLDSCVWWSVFTWLVRLLIGPHKLAGPWLVGTIVFFHVPLANNDQWRGVLIHSVVIAWAALSSNEMFMNMVGLINVDLGDDGMVLKKKAWEYFIRPTSTQSGHNSCLTIKEALTASYMLIFFLFLTLPKTILVGSKFWAPTILSNLCTSSRPMWLWGQEESEKFTTIS